MKVDDILRLLRQEYGERVWKAGQEPVFVLVQTVLSQNTSDANSHRAFESLLAAFADWESVAAADTEAVAKAIRQGGLADIKAGRIQYMLRQIEERRGSLDLSFLKGLPLPDARSWLRSLPGVGPKTASCVLLFSLGMPALPVDTHVFRVAGRLGLIDSKATPEKAHNMLEAMVPSHDVYAFHLYLIEHGRRVCKAQRPRCSVCVLLSLCPSGLEAQARPPGTVA